METMGKTLISMLLDGCTPGSGLYHVQANYPLQRRKKMRATIENKTEAILKRKINQKKWFHYAVNLNLIALIIMAFLLPLPGHLYTAYGFVCLVCGWLFYFTIDRLTHRLLTKFKRSNTTDMVDERGKLSQVAGKDLFSRFAMVLLLIAILITTVQVHPVFCIAIGLVARIMIESQIRVFINATSGHIQMKDK